MTLDEYIALTEAGILDKVELMDGVVMMGRFPLAFSADQIAAASEIGVDLTAESGAAGDTAGRAADAR